MSTSSSSSSVFRFIQKRFLASSSSNAVRLVVDKQESATKVLEVNSVEKHASVFDFFKSFGFSDAHISKIVVKQPWILNANTEKSLKPKIDCLVDYGFSASSLHDLIAAGPVFLSRSVNSHLLPTLRLLQTYFGSSGVAASLKRCSFLLSYGNSETVEKNVAFLVSEGVPVTRLSKLISANPRTIIQAVDRMVHAVNSAKRYGFSPVDPMFILAIRAFLCMSESTMSKKIEYVKNSLGLSEEEINALFKRDPRSFTFSEEKMKKVADFFVNTVRVESSSLPCIPKYFGYSVEKRLVPRYNVYKVLESKKLLKKGVKFSAKLIVGGEQWFGSNYVVKYLNQVPNLMEIYRGVSESSNMQSLTAASK